MASFRIFRLREGRTLRVLALCGCFLLCGALSARAVELWADEDSARRADLRTTLKLTGFASANPDDPIIYPNSTSVTGLTRTRFGMNSLLSQRFYRNVP